MKIAQALRKAGYGRTISSKSLAMSTQCHTSLVHWLLIETDSSSEQKVLLLEAVLSATDWRLDKEEKE